MSSLALLNKFCDALCLLNVPKKHYSNALSLILSPPILFFSTSSESLNSKSKSLTSNVIALNKTNLEKKKSTEEKSKKRSNNIEIIKLINKKKKILNNSKTNLITSLKSRLIKIL